MGTITHILTKHWYKKFMNYVKIYELYPFTKGFITFELGIGI
jgi:hypothetical protein